MLGNAVLGAVIVTTVVWLGLAPMAWVWVALEYLAIWSAGSTLLVAALGAWVAIGRARQEPRREAAVRRGSVAG
ncbi:hypothetical protein JMJ56_11800 [Belnapia sp. T18]|uniref:Uncharacterized protein n=1 Tax=Belnapia arida TaxID=2804533 RepID=A0ABS1U202_9PROT|nr:hypothetical protein [Belnapia arida]MBL6078693.1 hypothetical protein [Belnapia arida]